MRLKHIVETSAAVTHRIESSGPREARVRLIGLGSGAHTQEIGDGLIAEVRVDRSGADGILRVVYEGTAGTLRASTLTDPPRIVLDVARPVDPGAREDIYAVLKGLQESGTAILVTSSEPEQLVRLAERVAVVKEGRIVEHLDSRRVTVADITRAVL